MRNNVKRTTIKLEIKDGLKRIIRTLYYDRYNGYFIKYDGKFFKVWLDENDNWQVAVMKIIDVIL